MHARRTLCPLVVLYLNNFMNMLCKVFTVATTSSSSSNLFTWLYEKKNTENKLTYLFSWFIFWLYIPKYLLNYSRPLPENINVYKTVCLNNFGVKCKCKRTSNGSQRHICLWILHRITYSCLHFVGCVDDHHKYWPELVIKVERLYKNKKM